MTARWAVEAAENVHERRLARSTRTHDGDEFAASHLKRNTAHRVHFHFAGPIGLRARQLDDEDVDVIYRGDHKRIRIAFGCRQKKGSLALACIPGLRLAKR